MRIIAYMIFSFLLPIASFGASQTTCADPQPEVALQIFLKAEAEHDSICLLTARESIIENTFKLSDEKYSAFLDTLSKELEQRTLGRGSQPEAIDPVQNLVKGLQDKWFDLYILHAMESKRVEVIRDLGASYVAITLAIIYFYKSKSEALNEATYEGWKELIKNLLKDSKLMSKLYTALGLNAAQTSGKLFIDNVEVPPSPLEKLNLKQDNYWSHSEYTMIRDVVTFSASTTISVIGADKVTGVIEQALRNARKMMVSKAQTPTQKYLMKILNGYRTKIRHLLKAGTKASGSTPVSYAVSYVIGEYAFDIIEDQMNVVAQKISENILKKLERAYLAGPEKLSDEQHLAAVEEYVSALLWYSTVRSKKAIDSLTEAEETFLTKFACYSDEGKTTLPYFNRKDKRARYNKNLKKEIKDALEDWDERRAGNIDLIEKTIQNLKGFKRPYLNASITRLEGAQKLYELAGSQEYQYNSIYSRVSSQLGDEFMSGNYTSEIEDDVETRMSCPQKGLSEESWLAP